MSKFKIPELLKIPTEEFTVPRFNKTERLAHWLNAVTFLVLLFSGFSFCFPAFNIFSLENSKLFLVFHVAFGLVFISYILFLYLFKINRFPVREWKRHFSYFKSAKYNAGQKLNITLTSSFLILLLFSGIVLALSRYLPQNVTKTAFYLHNLGAFTMAFMMSGHIFLSLIFPSTNRSFMGIIIGKIEKQYALHHHPQWYKEISENKETDKS
jgi:formate dehydrogenase gamma subunit